ncbi:MAG: sterol desaturase family protein [Bacteroidota bacterium]|nr:sterol desaturase family protein [Bacteroidota bacterium]
MNTQKLILLNLAINLIRYFLIAGSAYFLFYVVMKSKWANKKIQAKYPDSKQIKSEIKNSIISIFIFAFVGILIYALNKLGFTQVYQNINKYGLIYFAFSIVFLLFFHDTYFYWSHRALHHPKLIRFHLTHHHSHNTTPFTSFSFHPVEALTQTGFVFIVLFIPINIYVLALVMLWQMFFNVAGHLGFEVFHKKFHNTIIGKQFNTVTHHNMHHRYTNHNFGLYFSIWDRIMKTNHKEYEQQYNINANKMYNQ